MPEIDLHTHSTASDGTLSPTALVAAAAAMKLRAIALTDHDTIQGLPEACAAGQELALEVISGCELSVNFPKGSMHILGLWIPLHPARLQSTLDRLSSLRRSRNETILRNLNHYGVEATYDELERIADGGIIGRPHIAQLLVSKGVALNLQDAFINWLRPGTKGYAPKEKLDPREGIDLLKEEGATVILAHPCTLHLEGPELEGLLHELKDWGLDGVEVIYSMHTQAQTDTYARLCRKLDLLQSAGSDFHGANKPNISLGRGKGGLRPTYRLVERMKERRAAQGLSIPSCS
ncbi:MAG: PHP domain-containing protein [Desulfovibrionales bacterium]|nr:PHP domain-containing protein [Desulfovibrionales bacterium]